MPRTNPQDIIEVLGDNYDTINCPSLKPYIVAANLIVSRVMDCIESNGEELSELEAKEMERWLAAYIYTIRDPIYLSKTTGNSSASFAERSYLDAATALDPTSCLSAQMKGTNLGLMWLGKVPRDQIDVDDRTTD